MDGDAELSGGAYEKYLALCKELLGLIARGEDDARGDDLRDQMDVEWMRMTNEEQELAEEDMNALEAAMRQENTDVRDE